MNVLDWKPKRHPILLGGALFLVVLCVSVFAIPQARWRVHVLTLYGAGQIRDIELSQLIRYMAPGSDQTLTWLIHTRSPYAVIRNYRSSPADIRSGSELFLKQCAVCHARDARGGAGGPSLIGRRLDHGESDWAIYRNVRLGVPNTRMPSHALSDTELWQTIGYIRSLDTPGARTKPQDLSTLPPVSVSYQQMAQVRETADDWLTYSGSYLGWRYSGLTEINRANANELALRWMYQLDGGERGEFQCSPIVRNGIMFVTIPPNRVVALDVANGKELWSYNHKLPEGIKGGEFGTMPNRGVAILNDNVYFGTVDAKLTALSASTGEVRWQASVSNDIERYYISAAPLAYRDLVVTGVGTRGGGRGFIVAFDANTGKERWRFFAIPSPGEPGHDTWAGNSWREGGAPTWLTGSYDPELDLLIWSVGNPKPDYDPALRLGDNLYTNSAIALRGSTGQPIWHFQFTPADDKDWDANQIPVLADFPSSKQVDKRILWANRNGFFYVLDRVSGKYVTAQPFAHQTWTAGLDANGRPKPSSDSMKNSEGFLLYPGNVGATNWWSPSYDPAQRIMFIPTLEQGMVYFTSSASPPKASGRPFYTAVRAVDGSTGNRIWEYRREPRPKHNKMGGLLSTKGGLVFGGDEGTFFALESHTGKLLWTVETGGSIVAAPVTYASAGQQFVSIAAGKALLTFSLPRKSAQARTVASLR